MASRFKPYDDAFMIGNKSKRVRRAIVTRVYGDVVEVHFVDDGRRTKARESRVYASKAEARRARRR